MAEIASAEQRGLTEAQTAGSGSFLEQVSTTVPKFAYPLILPLWEPCCGVHSPNPAHMKYVIEDTKTSSGTRIIPMTEEVYECFKRIVENRKKPKKEPVIDGYKGFLFLDKKDMPEVALHREKHFEWALAKHNRIYKEQLPKITPHVCRHTYCSNMAKSGMNPKTLQYLMGHSDIGVTLNTYTHLGVEDAKEELGKYAKMA